MYYQSARSATFALFLLSEIVNLYLDLWLRAQIVKWLKKSRILHYSEYLLTGELFCTFSVLNVLHLPALLQIRGRILLHRVLLFCETILDYGLMTARFQALQGFDGM